MSVQVDKLIGSKGSIAVDDLIDLLGNLSGSSQVGEDILRAPLAVDVRTILELVKQTNLVDITAGRMLQVGSFGLGASASVNAPRLNNLDDLSIPNGFYYVDTNSVGTFPGGLAARGMVTVERYPATNTIVQTFKYPGADTSILNYELFRTYNTSTNAWNAWSRNYNSSSILGIVSQLNGVPTGAIIERGSNANGEYVRLADGTQICRMMVDSNIAYTNQFGPGYYGIYKWTFPSVFSNNASVIFNAKPLNSIALPALGGDPGGVTTSNCDLLPFCFDTATRNTRLSAYAIGRWFN